MIEHRETDMVKLHSIELYRYFRRLEDKPQILDVEILDVGVFLVGLAIGE